MRGLGLGIGNGWKERKQRKFYHEESPFFSRCFVLMKASSSSTTTIIDDHWHIIIIIIIVYAVPALLHALQSATTAAADATFLLLPDHSLKHNDLQQRLSKTKSIKFIRMLHTHSQAHSQATIIIPTTTQNSSAIPSLSARCLLSLSFPQLGFLSFSFLGFSVFLRNFC